MAFRLRGSSFVAELRARSRERHVLFVERRDAESMGAGARPPVRVPLKRIAPAALKRPLKRWWVRARELSSGRNTPFFELAYGTAVAERPELRSLPVYAADVSDHSMYDFAGFCRAIAGAAAVVTNRLHVAILGALLEKPVWVSTGAYHKIRGIYEYSLTDDPRVRLLEDGPRG
jgi:exopolysaccharide biosynthesis predicted pyruvyltransferase EpsI